MSAATSFNSQDLMRMVIDFDRDKFNTPISTPKSYSRQTIVIHQLEKSLHTVFPIEIVDQIARSCFEHAPSVQALWSYYVGSPRVAAKYDLLPLSNSSFLNGTSKTLLLKLGLKPSKEKQELGYFKQLMTSVFEHHFHKADLSQKTELFQRLQVTPWEQKSPEEKLILFGRIQRLCGWSQPKIKLQFLEWKIKFAVARALKMIPPFVWILLIPLSTLILIALILLINDKIFKNEKIFSITKSIQIESEKDIETLKARCIVILTWGIFLSALSFGIGTVMAMEYFPHRIRIIGLQIQNVSAKCVIVFLNLYGEASKSKHDKSQYDLQKNLCISQELNECNQKLIENIKKTISCEQEILLEAQLPDLLEKWHFLISEKFLSNGINIGSSPTQPLLAEAETVR